MKSKHSFFSILYIDVKTFQKKYLWQDNVLNIVAK